MIRPIHILDDLVGKIAHLVPYAEKFAIANEHEYDRLFFFQNIHVCRMFFRFVRETPHWHNNQWYYCLEDSESGDYYWFCLNQLIICTENPTP